MATSRTTKYAKSEIRTGDCENEYRGLGGKTERTKNHLEGVDVSGRRKVK
jgi:hypothetical protein